MTVSELIEALIAQHPAGFTRSGKPRSRFGAGPWPTTSILERIVGPYVPGGTAGWALPPAKGQSVRDWAVRAVLFAAQRSSWAGGLQGVTGPGADGFPAPDLLRSVHWLVHRR